MGRHLGGGDGARGTRQKVEHAAGPTVLTVRVEGGGLVGQHLTQAAQQGGAAVHAHQRVVVTHLEGLRQPVGDEAAQAGGVGLQRVGRVAGEHAGRERMEAGHAQAFGAGEGLAAGGLHILPVGPRARVQQHTDEGQVDLGACPHGGRHVTQSFVQQCTAVHTTGFEVAPAAVEGDGVVGVAGAGHLGHQQGGLVQGGVEHPEVARATTACLRQQGLGAGADAVCGA